MCLQSFKRGIPQCNPGKNTHHSVMSFEHIFDEMDIDANPFALCELQGKCDLGMSRQPFATLHYVLSGEGEIRFQGQSSATLARGSLVLVPAMEPHILRSFGKSGNPIPQCRPAELDLVRLHKLTDETKSSDRLIAICARIRVGMRGIEELIDLVQEPIVESVSGDSMMAAPVESLLRELSQPMAGSKAMIRAILLQCMIYLLRQRIIARDRSLVWMEVLQDKSLWAALHTMMDTPGTPHSVESLAHIAGMSRTKFAKRFSDACGKGPMEVLRDLRMKKAAALLNETDLPVKRIAELVGFQSRTAFTRTFEKTLGVSPSSVRNSLD